MEITLKAAMEKPRAGNRWVCSLHEGPKAALVAEGILQGLSAYKIEEKVRAAGYPVKARTILRHQRNCGSKKQITLLHGTDVAEMVRDKVANELAQGKLRVNVKDGLTAQALIDRREEKRASREFMLNLAQLLSGGGKQTPAQLIEGDFVELEGENPLLAPPELREEAV